MLVGDFNYEPNRKGTEIEVDDKIRQFVEETGLQNVSHNRAPGLSLYPAPEGATESRIDAVYTDLHSGHEVTVRQSMGKDELKERKGHRPMMLTLKSRVEGPGDEEGKQ